MALGPINSYYNSLVKIMYENGNPAGTGVIIGQDLILTCAHVIANVLEIPHEYPIEKIDKKKLTVKVARFFVDGQFIGPESVVSCRVVKYEHRYANTMIQDLVILEAPSGRYPIKPPLSISRFSKVKPSQGDIIRVTGFPIDAVEKVGQSIDATYRLTGYQANAWLTSIAHESYGDEIRPGFSGDPVLDEKSKHLIGIICEADEARRTATIIPTSTILAFTTVLTIDDPTEKNEGENKDAPLVVFKTKSSPLRTALELLFPRLHYLLTVRFRLLEDLPERSYIECRLSEQKAEWSEELRSKTYLPPPAKEVPKPPEQIQLKKAKFYTPIQQLIKEVAGLSTGGDSSSAQISALSKKSRRIRNLVTRLESSDAPLIVLGDPGAGKTITLKQVAIEISARNAIRVLPNLCLFISLGRWKPVEKPGIKDIEKLVEENAGAKLAPLLSALADQQRLVIIFDGLDEMSRFKYNEHTEALSKYAERYKGKIKTLFSCRIADFSPAFKHNRLVLLPFNQKHITQYLLKQFGNTTLSISNEEISTRKLGKRLVHNSLPIQPRNPFSLWLLSLYLREEQEWPETRTTLLEFLYNYQYDRKIKEQQILTQEKKEEYFKAWSKIALTVTRQNRGSDIGLHTIRSIFGSKADNIISAGRSCGILQQSLETDPPRVRFEHHRAQEYFTARGIIESKLSLDWKKLLLVPRWQETFVNIAQMSAEDAPLPGLIDSLNESLQEIKKVSNTTSEDIMDYDENDEKNDYQATPFEKAIVERTASERIDLSVRVISAVQASNDKETLTKCVHEASVCLAEEGNPTSQIKMLRLTDQLPDQTRRDVVESTRHSKVAWVRNHANEVATSISGSINASPLPIEIANAYGNGEILTSLISKFSMAKKLKSIGLAIISAMSFIMLIGNMFIIASIAPAVSYKYVDNVTLAVTMPKIKSINEKIIKNELTTEAINRQLTEIRDAALLYKKWLPWLILITSTLALIGSVIWLPNQYWLITGATGLGIFFLATLAYGLWIYAPDATLPATVLFLVAMVFLAQFLFAAASFTWILLAIAVSFIFSLVLGIAISIWTKDYSNIKSTIGSVLRNGEYLSLADELKVYWITRLGLGFLMIIMIYVRDQIKSASNNDKWWVWLLTNIDNYVPEIPISIRFFDYLVTILVLVGILMLITQSISLIRSTNRDKFRQDKRGYYSISLGAFLAAGMVLLYGIFFRGVVYLIKRSSVWFEDFSASWLLQAVVALLGILLVVATIGTFFSILRYMWKRHALNFLTLTSYSTQSEFKRVMESNDTEKKLLFLNKFGPTELRIDAEDYFQLLIDVEANVIEEPALSRYYQRRIEIEEIIRQERHG